jgi:hypothetical protein
LTASAIERYRKVGELMLRSDIVACLLPLFVLVVEDAVEAMLNDEEAAGRLVDAFKGKQLSERSPCSSWRVDCRARNLLVESGTEWSRPGKATEVNCKVYR